MPCLKIIDLICSTSRYEEDFETILMIIRILREKITISSSRNLRVFKFSLDMNQEESPNHEGTNEMSDNPKNLIYEL